MSNSNSLLKSDNKDNYNASKIILITALSSSISGMLGKLATHPLDTIKHKL